MWTDFEQTKQVNILNIKFKKPIYYINMAIIDTETYYLVKEIYSEDSDGISVQTIQEYSNYIN